MPDLAKLYYCGLLANQARNSDGLQAILRDFFGIPVKVEEFVGEWLALPTRHLTSLGGSSANCTLGESAVIGLQVWSNQHKFRIVLGPLDFDDYVSFLPPEQRLQRVKAVVRNYIGDELAWDLNLILQRQETPATRLNGHFRLGWTSWLGKRQTPDDANDLTLQGG